jgi:hypothetical protein
MVLKTHLWKLSSFYNLTVTSVAFQTRSAPDNTESATSRFMHLFLKKSHPPHTHTRVLAHKRTHTHTHTHTHTRARAHAYSHTHIRTHTRTHTHAYTHNHTQTHTHNHTHTHTHNQTHILNVGVSRGGRMNKWLAYTYKSTSLTLQPPILHGGTSLTSKRNANFSKIQNKYQNIILL